MLKLSNVALIVGITLASCSYATPTPTTNNVVPPVSQEQINDCTFGGKIREKAVNNLKFKNEIDEDYRVCLSNILDTDLYRKNPASEREECMTFAHRINGGISPTVLSITSPQTRLTDLYESIKHCGNK